jgi:hypothetical protein
VAKVERGSARGSCRISKAKTGAQFTCFTSTKVLALLVQEYRESERLVSHLKSQNRCSVYLLY